MRVTNVVENMWFRVALLLILDIMNKTGWPLFLMFINVLINSSALHRSIYSLDLTDWFQAYSFSWMAVYYQLVLNACVPTSSGEHTSQPVYLHSLSCLMQLICPERLSHNLGSSNNIIQLSLNPQAKNNP